jgi:hypothetical protein
VEITATEETDQTDDDQVYGDNVVQHSGHDQNENPGDQRYQGSKPERDIHDETFPFRIFGGAAKENS